MDRTYRYLLKGVLEQKSPLNTGGSRNPFTQADSETEYLLDNPLSLDGAARPTLRGTTLAGALLATARSLYGELPSEISQGAPGQQQNGIQNRLEESRWIFHHAHPLPESGYSTFVRHNIGVRQTTGAARDGAKYDFQVVPAGTRWSFLLEVDVWRESGAQSEQGNVDETEPGNGQADRLVAMALNALSAWEAGACWLGSRVAQGQGWLILQKESLDVIRLDAKDALVWPDSDNGPLDSDGGLILAHGCGTKLDSDAIRRIQQRFRPLYQPFHFGSIRFYCGAEPGSDGWGVDAVSSLQGDGGAGKPTKLEQYRDSDAWIMPLGQEPEEYLDGEMDGRLGLDSAGRWTLQGASLRGSLRHAMSWLLRRRGMSILEPGEPAPEGYDSAADPVKKLFGVDDESGLLLIGDAFSCNTEWRLLCQEMHAEDEFTQGVFGQAKFDRPQLFNVDFEAEYCLLKPLDMGVQDFQHLIEVLLESINTLGRYRLIQIGGGIWRGLGWVRVEIQRPCLLGVGAPDTEVQPLEGKA